MTETLTNNISYEQERALEKATEMQRLKADGYVNPYDNELSEHNVGIYDKKFVPFYFTEDGRVMLIEKLPTSHKTAYLWEIKPVSPKDDIDKRFIQNRDSFVTMSSLSLHTCGYPGLFKPDAVEVINVLSRLVSLEFLEKNVDRVYATTRMTSSAINMCYAGKNDMHKGECVFYIVMKTDGLFEQLHKIFVVVSWQIRKTDFVFLQRRINVAYALPIDADQFVNILVRRILHARNVPQ
jgi:hypothetical protein